MAAAYGLFTVPDKFWLFYKRICANYKSNFSPLALACARSHFAVIH